MLTAGATLHVWIDEGGGGAAHLRAIREAAPERFSELRLDRRRLGRSVAGWFYSALTIRRTVRSTAPRVVHAHGLRAAIAVLLGTIGTHARRVVSFHGLHLIRRARRWHPLVRFFYRTMLIPFRAVLVLSESDRDELVSMGVGGGGRVTVISGSFDAPASYPRDEARELLGITGPEPVALWLGRFGEEKDPLTFVRAMRRVEGVTAVMVGDGPLLAEARAMASAQGSGILFSGWLDDPAPAYAAADVFVATSLWEGLPIAVLEAAAAGVPAILSSCPGNRDLVANGLAAETFEPGDDAGLAERIRHLLADPERRLEISETGRTFVLGSYTGEHLIEDLERAYAKVVSD